MIGLLEDWFTRHRVIKGDLFIKVRCRSHTTSTMLYFSSILQFSLITIQLYFLTVISIIKTFLLFFFLVAFFFF